GRYGGQNGTGGFEATASGMTFSPLIADAFGNVLATVSSGSVSWSSSRVSAYGAVPGYKAPSIGFGNVGLEYAWRNRAADSIGFVWLGGNWLDPVGGRFLSFDPLGHEASDNGYTFCGGNPIGYIWDADGRATLFQSMFPATSAAAGAPPWSGSVQGDIQHSRQAFAPIYGGAAAANAIIGNPYVQGGLKVVGGTGEMIVGGTGVVATSPTVAGSIVSGAAFVHGADTFQSGVRQLWTGEHTPSFTSHGITAVTGSPVAGELGDAGLGIAFSFGSGFMTQGPRVGSMGGRVTQFYNPAGGSFGPGASQALSSPVTAGGRIIDGASGIQTWVAPAAANDMNWFQRMMTGVGSRTSYVEFDVAAGELTNPGGLKGLTVSPWQQVLNGEISLTGRNPVWGDLGLNYGQYGFMGQLGSAAGRDAGVILSKH
ncbi:MAG TPA: hypothetical protein VEC99_12710, partial [Clostridia bacterium]|nr:hypothetical protein [Clostridia bacterium]